MDRGREIELAILDQQTPPPVSKPLSSRAALTPTAVYHDIDELYPQQAAELNHKEREAILHKMQQLVYEKVIAAPIWQLAGLAGVGPRVDEATIGSMGGYPWLSPYEDVTLKAD
jgi:ABC-type transport system substrate-binding protein